MMAGLSILPFAAILSLWWSLPPAISLSLDLFTNFSRDPAYSNVFKEECYAISWPLFSFMTAKFSLDWSQYSWIFVHDLRQLNQNIKNESLR